MSNYLARLGAIYTKLDAKLARRAGATAAAIGALEKKSSVRIPKELRALWRATNGSGDQPFFANPGFLTGYALLSVTGAWREREALRRRAPQYEGYDEPKPRGVRIEPGWFEPGWLPFADFGGGTLVLMLDFSPTTRGRKGQVIAFTHDPDHISWVAPSFASFLGRSLSAIRRDPEEVLALY